MDSDKIGNALKQYYKIFGFENEGPPDNLNVNSLLPSTNFLNDIERIESICCNQEAIRKHSECKDLLDSVANALTDAKFMEELNQSILSSSEPEREHLSNGMFWHYLANTLDPKASQSLGIDIPMPKSLSKISQHILRLHGSLIFRLYITLVYMKEGPLIKMLKTTAINKQPIAQKANKLLRCDYIRHLRNALAHSTFEPTICGIYFKDEDKFEVIASPAFLASLSTWIMLLNYQCSIVLDLKSENNNKHQ